MQPVIPVPTIPIPPVPPAPPPPSDWQKRIPFIISSISTAFVGIGAYVQTTLLPNSDFLAMFPYAANIPGICSMVVGFCGFLLAQPYFSSNIAKKMQDVIDHKNDVIDHKDAVIDIKTAEVVSTEARVESAAAAPALIPSGENPVNFRLRHAAVEAMQTGDYDAADAIMKLMRARTGKAAVV